MLSSSSYFGTETKLDSSAQWMILNKFVHTLWYTCRDISKGGFISSNTVTSRSMFPIQLRASFIFSRQNVSLFLCYFELKFYFLFARYSNLPHRCPSELEISYSCIGKGKHKDNEVCSFFWKAVSCTFSSGQDSTDDVHDPSEGSK